MNTCLLIGINTKYIHPNLAIRLLKKNTKYPCDIAEFLIKDDNEYIINTILDKNYSILGFSCYIWNIEKILLICQKIKEKKPNTIILLGGPEVSYDYQNIISLDYIDYIIKDEGEVTFDLFLKYVNNNYCLSNIANLVSKTFDNPSEYVPLDKISSAYDLEIDYKNQIIYFESNRGCPFRCSYCLSSKNNKVRFFTIDKIKDDLKFLLEKGVKTIKFLDRNFTTNKMYALEIIQFLEINKNSNSSFQFEINLDILSKEFLEKIGNIISKGYFRFEVGIQTLNALSNKLVDRIQNNQQLIDNLYYLKQQNKIAVHADLIFGLPEDTLNDFKNTFNIIIKTKPKELQLGFLKFLKGTKLRDEYKKYNYIFETSSPYEIIESNTFSKQDLAYTKIVENALDHYYNKNLFERTFDFIINREENMFDFFYSLGLFFNERFQNSDKQFIIYAEILIEHLKCYNYFDQVYPLILFDYYHHFNMKPKILGKSYDKKTKNNILKKLFEENIYSLSLDDFFKYCNIVYINNNTFLFYCYKNNLKIIEIKVL